MLRSLSQISLPYGPVVRSMSGVIDPVLQDPSSSRVFGPISWTTAFHAGKLDPMGFWACSLVEPEMQNLQGLSLSCRVAKPLMTAVKPNIQLHGNERGRPKTSAYTGTRSEEEIGYRARGAIAEDNHLPEESTPWL